MMNRENFLGRLITVLSTLLILTIPSGKAAAETITYTYDVNGRLIRADYGGGKSIEYTYDPAGNIVTTRTSTPENTLRVLISPPGAGSVSGTGIACPPDCMEAYSGAPDVSLAGAAEASFQFLGWGGAASGAANPFPVTMDGDKNVIAYFGAVDQATDTDGIPDTAEMGPGGNDPSYDGDGNGVADYQEAGVASLPAVSGGAYATITVPPGLTLSNVQAIPNPSPSDTPAHLGFPYGFFEFTVNGLAPGGCTTVTVYLTPKYPGLSTYYKYGPTPDNATAHWYEFLQGSGSTGARIVHETGRTRIELAFCDGQRGDDVATQDGLVIDQGGPVVMQYTLQVNRTGTGTGTVTSDIGGIDCGSDCSEVYDVSTAVKLTAMADPGSRFVAWSGGGCSGTGQCSPSMTADRTVTANFALTHTITVSYGSGGSISPAGPTVVVDHGTNKTFKINPSTGYHVKDVLVDGGSVGAVTSYTFENVVSDHSISATFEINTYSIEATAGPNGKIEPSGTLAVTHGGSQSFTITADAGYHPDVLVDGTSVGPVSTYTFSSASASHTIHADFLAGEYIVKLPKTGQSRSLAAGDDGFIQAGIPWPVPRFTNPDGTVPISGDAVMDQLTGVMWTRDGKAPGPSGCGPGTTKTWAAALTYISCLNTNNYLGYNDWRLPNVIELESLGHGGEPDIAAWLMSQGFINVQAGLYWSSTTNIAATATSARSVSLQGGALGLSTKATAQNVWPVRGTTMLPAQLWRTGQTTSYGTRDDGNLKRGAIWPSPRFKAGADVEAVCMTDMLTGLIWPKSPDTTKRTWQEALDHVNGLDLCGHTDWRLSNRKELLSLIHFGQSNPASWLNNPAQGFTGVQADKYWSSTTTGDTDAEAWTVNLGNGEVAESAKEAAWYVFPVTGGSFLSVEPAEGTIGTTLTIRGGGFGIKKGKVLIGGVAVKVVKWGPDEITCLLSKVPAPGVYDVVIQRKEPKGAEPIIEKKLFSVKGPEIGLVDPNHGGEGTEVTITGDFFGTKKGKVYIGARSCKVTSWTMIPETGESAIKFQVPKGLAKGAQDVTITNKVGTTTFPGGFTID